MSRRVKPVRRQAAERKLPRSFHAAWGLPSSAERGPKPALTLARIVRAALDIAAAHGLDAVSMNRVAAELGVATMSLYRYVSAKDELLALMIDATLEAAPEKPSSAEGWRQGLSRWALEYLTVLHRHPWVVRVPLSGPPILPNQVRWFERGLECLSGTSLTEAQKVSALLLLNGFVRNEVLLTSDLQTASRGNTSAARQGASAYGQLLSKLADSQRFPAIRAVLDAGVFNGADDPDAGFTFGLDRILDGVAALMRRQRRGSQ
jgi:AcrR family transcriptional regulator